jgi:hypothetical protein
VDAVIVDVLGIVAKTVVEHPAPSVTITVYTPAHMPVAVAAIEPPGDHVKV